MIPMGPKVLAVAGTAENFACVTTLQRLQLLMFQTLLRLLFDRTIDEAKTTTTGEIIVQGSLSHHQESHSKSWSLRGGYTQDR